MRMESANQDDQWKNLSIIDDPGLSGGVQDVSLIQALNTFLV